MQLTRRRYQCCQPTITLTISPHVSLSLSKLKPTSSYNTFCLIVRDRKSTIEKWEEQPEICKNITSSLTKTLLDSNEQVFRISSGNGTSNAHQHQQRLSMNGEGLNVVVPILAYRCHSNVKPIPVVGFCV